MKTLRILTLALGLAVSVSYTATAQDFGVSTGGEGAGISMDGGEKKAKKKKKSKKADKKADKKKATVSPVGKAVGKLKTFNGKPNKKAQVYIYLQSASWCGPCNQEMPEVAEAYKEMEKDGRAELILLGHDQTEDGAKKFLKQYKAKFPGLLVGGEGNVLASGYPSSVLAQWKQAVESLNPAEEEEPEEDSEL